MVDSEIRVKSIVNAVFCILLCLWAPPHSKGFQMKHSNTAKHQDNTSFFQPHSFPYPSVPDASPYPLGLLMSNPV